MYIGTFYSFVNEVIKILNTFVPAFEMVEDLNLFRSLPRRLALTISLGIQTQHL